MKLNLGQGLIIFRSSFLYMTMWISEWIISENISFLDKLTGLKFEKYGSVVKFVQTKVFQNQKTVWENARRFV